MDLTRWIKRHQARVPYRGVRVQAKADASGRRSYLLLVAACLLGGCQSSPVLNSQYISPRVTGRVLDAANSHPIRNVSIRRLTAGQLEAVSSQGVGDRSLERTPALRTDKDGRFDLDSERDLTLFRRAGWYSVTLAFTRKGYERFVTNYTLTSAVVASNGEPVVDAGSIMLQPVSNKLTLK
jgi:hypothetical protein